MEYDDAVGLILNMVPFMVVVGAIAIIVGMFSRILTMYDGASSNTCLNACLKDYNNYVYKNKPERPLPPTYKKRFIQRILEIFSPNIKK
jgi:hypothetical protein